MEVRSIEAVIRALNEAGVRYLVVGGVAVNAYGYERLTRDLDLVIGLEPDNITRGLRALVGVGYAPAIPVTAEQFADFNNRENWRRDKNMIVLKLWSDAHRRTPIDVFVYEPFDFNAEYDVATRIEVASGLIATFVRRDSLLEMKRLAGRPRDLEDIAKLERLEKISEDGRSDES